MKHLTLQRLVVVLVPLFFSGCATPALWDRKVHEAASVPRLEYSSERNDVLVQYQEGKCAWKLKPLADRAWLAQPKHGLAKDFDRLLEPRAYWLFAATNVAKRRPPPFVDLTNDNALMLIPLADLTKVQRFFTNPQDIEWLLKDSRGWRAAASSNAPPEPAHFISAGTNVLGQSLYVTNARPKGSYYWKISASPTRYITLTNIPPEHGYYAALFQDQLALWRDGQELGTFQLPIYTTWGGATYWRIGLTPLAVAGDTTLIAVGTGLGLALGGVAGGGGIPHF